jgi:hypothetical protein
MVKESLACQRIAGLGFAMPGGLVLRDSRVAGNAVAELAWRYLSLGICCIDDS